MNYIVSPEKLMTCLTMKYLKKKIEHYYALTLMDVQGALGASLVELDLNFLRHN